MSCLYSKKKYVIRIKALKQALDHGLILEKVHRVIEFKKCLAVELNYHTRKCFSENLVAIETNEINVKMDKSIYLGPSILDISKIAMYSNDMIMQNQGMETMLNYVTWLRTAS